MVINSQEVSLSCLKGPAWALGTQGSSGQARPSGLLWLERLGAGGAAIKQLSCAKHEDQLEEDELSLGPAEEESRQQAPQEVRQLSGCRGFLEEGRGGKGASTDSDGRLFTRC